MNASGTSYSSSNINAQKYAQQQSERILSNNTLSHKIASAYRELGTGEAVATALHDELELPETCALKTRTNIILLVVSECIPDSELQEIRSHTRKSMQDTINENIVAKKMENGSQIFNEERTAYLMELNATTPSYRGRYERIAQQMNDRFNVSVFTRINCAKKVENVKRARKLEVEGRN